MLMGSHDPQSEWMLRELGNRIVTFFGGSLDGLMRLGEGKADLRLGIAVMSNK